MTITTYTTAPEVYDGFGSYTVRLVGWRDGPRIFREVSTPAEHVEWQRARYSSGCYAAMDEKHFVSARDAGLFHRVEVPV